jgi:hypothetical protein
VVVIEVKVGIYIHVHVQPKRMPEVTAVTPALIVRVVAGDDIRVLAVVARGGIVVFTSDPY